MAERIKTISLVLSINVLYRSAINIRLLYPAETSLLGGYLEGKNHDLLIHDAYPAALLRQQTKTSASSVMSALCFPILLVTISST